MNFTETINQSTWPADAIEQEIPDIEAAEVFLRKNLPDVLSAVKWGNDELIKRVGAGVPEMPDLAYRVSVLCLARMALRHGSLAQATLAYHNERHPLDVLDHLHMIISYQKQLPPQPNPKVSLHHVGPISCLCLSLFAATHDVRQSLKGGDGDGIGHNERASADEAIRVLKQAGLQPQQHAGIFQLLRWMIYGSTFFARTTPLKSDVVEPGALAPLVAEKILRQDVVMGPFSARHAAELVMLATDIDTANVAESIDHYAQQSVKMCREAHHGKEIASDDQQISRSVLAFLTGGQQQYFFHQQRFYSVMALRALSLPKQRTGESLKQIITWMQENFSESDSSLPSGQVIMQAFWDQANHLASKSTDQHAGQPASTGMSGH